jgi:parvulin-like peptidyl-prolyl isomerase
VSEVDLSRQSSSLGAPGNTALTSRPRSGGGDLGYFFEVRKLAFSLKLNEIGGPVEGDGKWYLVMKTGERKAMKRSFESVKEGLRMRILERKRRELVKREFARIIKGADIQLNEDAIARLQKKLREERAWKRRGRQ